MGARKITEAQIEQACELREQGWTYQRISNHFSRGDVKISPGSIAWHCLVNGADLPAARRRPAHSQPGKIVTRGQHVVRSFTPEEDAKILELEATGMGYSEIGRQLPSYRPPNSIRGRLATLARHDARAEDAA